MTRSPSGKSLANQVQKTVAASNNVSGTGAVTAGIGAHLTTVKIESPVKVITNEATVEKGRKSPFQQSSIVSPNHESSTI